MISLKNNIYHTHMCGKLTAKYIGAEVKVAGWVNSIRKLGALTFLTLRDQTGIVQVFVEDEKTVKDLAKESVVSISGLVRSRGEKNVNEAMETGEIEVVAKEIKMLGTCTQTLPFEIAKAREQNENTRLKYRYLDLRNKQNFSNIILRSELLNFVRQQMNALDFLEVQTPILTSSSPEGARDFLVPSRMNPGNFYALPQSPQQFKQLLMVSGFPRYFQLAPCFRDEDARADRSPTDFYQIDLEASFVTQEEILEVMETLMYNIFTKFSQRPIDKPPFTRLKFSEAMEKFGSDKPDLRNPLLVIDLSKTLSKNEFSLFENHFIFGIKAKANESGRRFFDALTLFVKNSGGDGLIYLKFDGEAFSGPAAKYLQENDIKNLVKTAALEAGDTLFIITDKKRERALKLIGFLRNELGDKLNLIDKNVFKPCFIVDFPFFEDGDGGKIEFSHNPFSMPQGGLDALKNKNPFDILAYQYDFVMNGVELASGAVRNHSPEVMVEAFRLAGYSKEVVENKFPALFNAFKFGAPPHAGAAFGFDRIVMFITDEESIKEVLAFPMNKSGQDPLMGAPNTVSEQQLKDIRIKLDL